MTKKKNKTIIDESNTDRYYTGEHYDPWDLARLNGTSEYIVPLMLDEVTVTAPITKEAYNRYWKNRRKKELLVAAKMGGDAVREATGKAAPYVAMFPLAGVAGPLAGAFTELAPMVAPGTAGGNMIGNFAKDMLIYEGANRLSKATTGATPGEHIRNTLDNVSMGAIPRYFDKQIGGNAAYDLLTEAPTFSLGSKVVAPVANQVFTATKNIITRLIPRQKAVANNLLALIAMEHPYTASKVYNVVEQKFPKEAEAFNTYVEDAAHSLVRAGLGIDLSRRGRFLTPSVTPKYHPNTGAKMNIFDRATVGKEALIDAVAEERYLPYMTPTQVKRRINTFKGATDDVLDRVVELNRPAIKKEQELNLERYIERNTYFADEDLPKVKKYLEVVETTNDIGRSSSNPADLIQTAKELGISENEFKALKRLFQFKGRPEQLRRLVSALEAIPSLQQETNQLPLSLDDSRPSIKLVHRPYMVNPDGTTYTGVYKLFGDKGPSISITTKEHPHIIRKFANSSDGDSFSGILGHESDHWALALIPHVNDEAVIGENYWVANPYNDSFMQSFPEYGNGAFKSSWQGSPHEIRSEVKNWIIDHNLPSDPGSWTKSLTYDYTNFMNHRFKDFANELYTTTAGLSPLWNEMIKLGFTPQQIALSTAGTRTPALIGLDMYTQGYKSGGKLNYLNYIK